MPGVSILRFSAQSLDFLGPQMLESPGMSDAEKLRFSQPPRGLRRLLARLPILLFRWNLEWILGKRFLLLYHLGRKSGILRQVVVEVLRHDQGVWILASGWGEKADWYKNLLKSPKTSIKTGGQVLNVRAEFLDQIQAERELEVYARRHPIASRALLRVFRTHPEQQFLDMVHQFRLVRLIPDD